MTSQSLVVAALFATSLAVFAQSKRRDGVILPKGSVSVSLTPIDEPISLRDLVNKADLIVEGTALSVLPAFNLSPNETDSLIGVTKIIGGSLPETLRTISVAQLGGKVGEAEAVVADHPLLIWGGKAKVEGGQLRFSANASTDTGSTPH